MRRYSRVSDSKFRHRLFDRAGRGIQREGLVRLAADSWEVTGMKTKSTFTALFLSALAVFSTGATAQDQDGFSNPLDGITARECLASAFECFQLFNHCEPIGVSVGVSLVDIDRSVRRRLTEDRVRTAVESRLRAARLFDSRVDLGPYLLVAVDASDTAFLVTMNFHKWMMDEASGNLRLGGAYPLGTYGTHGDDADYLLGVIPGLMDQFINDYLRVNEPACD